MNEHNLNEFLDHIQAKESYSTTPLKDSNIVVFTSSFKEEEDSIVAYVKKILPHATYMDCNTQRLIRPAIDDFLHLGSPVLVKIPKEYFEEVSQSYQHTKYFGMTKK